ncbi:MAG TPA: DNA repair protein RecN, partial [Chloroflexota bacterium]|nr:DNA repair protein RecN [Chloroflexota bacterium]
FRGACSRLHFAGRMLRELTVRNFALLEEVDLRFEPGLNVLTGETGAGKSIIIDAIGTVLGGRASTEVVRTGAERATIQARFALEGEGAETVASLLREAGVERNGADGEVTLSREIGRNGRSVARIEGRTVPVSTLAHVGGALVDIHGQHEHLSLLRPGAQRDLLDHHGGLVGQRQEVAALVRELRRVRADLRTMQQDEREIARRIDLLSYQVEEIQQAKLRPGEDTALEQERTRLANASRLAELAGAIHDALAGGAGSAGGAGDTPGAIDLLGQAERSLTQLLRIDPQLGDREALLIEATAQIEELAQTVRAYQESIEFAPERLAEVEERLDLLHTLQRKYGETIDDVLRFAEAAGVELEGLVNREQRTVELEGQAAQLEAKIGTTAQALSAARLAAGERLAKDVAAEMAALSLKGAFYVMVEHEPSTDGVPVGDERLRFDDTGIDTVDFRFAPNPGEPAKSVARTASGGELSRILLALKAVLSAADRTPTLIFDEVDAGIGGRNGQVVGQKLAQIGRRHQVLCVTHLPQIAAFGDAHFFIAKRVSGGRTVTTVTALDAGGRDKELAQMLGGVSGATLAQARELTHAAQKLRPRARRGVSGVLQGVS